MLNQLYSQDSIMRYLRGGPLGPHIDTFARSLEERGYLRKTLKRKIALVADLSHWLKIEERQAETLTDALMDEFLKHRAKHGRTTAADRTALRDLLVHLRDVGVIPRPTARMDSNEDPVREIETAFVKHLASVRSLSRGTQTNYSTFAGQFLEERYPTGPITLCTLCSTDVTDFILRHTKHLSSRSVKVMGSSLRSFFRFLYQRGDTKANLAASVPRMKFFRTVHLPEFLQPFDVERLLDSCDRHTVTGRRDYAILILLARLGLRSGEVVRLTLEDIDWKKGEITVEGKSARVNTLPIPHDVGKALADYLQHGRPRCSSRKVFIRVRPPFTGLVATQAISNVFRQALNRTGLDPYHKGARVLRHSLATRMLRAGNTLDEIGSILGHRQRSTTKIYAKVNTEALRSLALPWPGGGS